MQINLPTKRGADIPILCSAIRIGDSNRIVAVGRDLLAVSVLQQKLVDAQQSMERDYLRLRHVETRYRLLFQMSSEAVLIVDPASRKIQEANPAALSLLSAAGKQLAGRDFADLFQAQSRSTVEALLTLVRSAGHADEVSANAVDGGRELFVSASLFRQDNSSLFLVRVVPAVDSGAAELSSVKTALLKTIDVVPDGFVLTNSDGRVLATNAAFRDMAQLAGEDQARTGALEQWLGRPGVDMERHGCDLAPARDRIVVRDHLAGRVWRKHRSRDFGRFRHACRPDLLRFRDPECRAAHSRRFAHRPGFAAVGRPI